MNVLTKEKQAVLSLQSVPAWKVYISYTQGQVWEIEEQISVEV